MQCVRTMEWYKIWVGSEGLPGSVILVTTIVMVWLVYVVCWTLRWSVRMLGFNVYITQTCTLLKICVSNTMQCPKKMKVVDISNFKVSRPNILNSKAQNSKLSNPESQLQAQNLNSQNLKFSELRISNLKNFNIIDLKIFKIPNPISEGCPETIIYTLDISYIYDCLKMTHGLHS